MSWQDVVLAIGQVLFIVALVPALRSSAKPPRSTCALTGGTLLASAFALATLGLWWAALSMAGTGACWLVLFGQRRQRKEYVIRLSDTGANPEQVAALAKQVDEITRGS